MSARRSLALLATGAAGAAAVLAASPAAYETLRRRLGLADAREHFVDAPEVEPPSTEAVPTGNALRLSLRARLAEDAEVDAGAGETAPPVEADPRARLQAARARLEAAAASASAAVEAPGDPGALEDDTAELPLPDAAER